MIYRHNNAMIDNSFLHRLLGGMPPAIFLKRYWQRRPLYIQNALDPKDLQLTRDELFDLASSSEVESRLVQNSRGRWQLSHGPFQQLPAAKKDWTLLVQGVNWHHDGAHALLQKFRFLPQARLDDLMISYAVAGGGVGAHFDSYDVFLLQAQGRRRWRISAQSDLSLKADLPLKILDCFTPEQEFICEPGDLLYLPPRYAHEGVALDPCMTFSVGFRAPSHQEWVTEFYLKWSEHLDLEGRYADPKPDFHADRPGEIPIQMLSVLTDLIQKKRPEKKDLTLFLGEYLSEPKPHLSFKAQSIRPDAFVRRLKRSGLALNKRSLMLYHGSYVFLNGESFMCSPLERKPLHLLANQGYLTPQQCQLLNNSLLEQCHVWFQNGWLHLHTKTSPC
ncbi:MAG: JmjC domain-containing protein [Burkholderiales bacterium]